MSAIQVIIIIITITTTTTTTFLTPPTPSTSHHALVTEGRIRARLLLHAGLRIEAARIIMEMEEDIAEESLQAEVRALSEAPKIADAVNLDQELMRLLKGPG